MSYYSLLPKDIQWPTLLGKELGIERVINYGEGCGSNPRILRTTLDYLNNGQDLEETLAIIQTSNPFRFEFQFANSWIQCNNLHAATKNRAAASLGEQLISLKLKTYTKETEFNEYFQQALAIEHLLKSSPIKKYFFINYSAVDDFDGIDIAKVDMLNKTVSWACSSNVRESSIFKSNYNAISDKDPHPSPLGHQQIKDWILNLIKDNI